MYLTQKWGTILRVKENDLDWTEVSRMGSWFVVFLVVFIVAISSIGWIGHTIMAALKTIWNRFARHFPRLSHQVAGWGWAGLVLAAIALEAEHEYCVALLLVVAAAASLVATCIHWKGLSDDPGLTKAIRLFGLVFAVLIATIGCVWILGSKGNEPCSRLPIAWDKLIKRNKPVAELKEEPFVDPPLIFSDAEQLPHVDLTKRALIKGAAGDGYFCRPGGGGITEVHLMLGIIDLGIPTSLGGWELRYESPRLKQSFRYIEIDDHDVCNDRSLAFKFNRANSIYEQTDKRIESNTKYRGWARFQVPGFLYKEIGTKDAQLTIEFSDNQGKKYTITYIGTGNSNVNQLYYPGVSSPITKADPSIADVRWCPPEPAKSIPWGFTAGYCNYGPATAKSLDSFVSERTVALKSIRNHTYLSEQQREFLTNAKHELEIDPRPHDVVSGHNMHGNIMALPVDVPLIRDGTKVVVLRGYGRWNDSAGIHQIDTCVWLKPPTLPPKKGKSEELVWNDCNLF